MTITFPKNNHIYYGDTQNKKTDTPNTAQTVIKTTAIGAVGAITGLLLTRDKDVDGDGFRYRKLRQSGEKPQLALKMKMKEPGPHWRNAIIGALIFIASDYIGEKLYKYFKKDK